MKSHHPPHIYLDDTIYFITARTYNRKSLFDSDIKKSLLFRVIKEVTKQLDCLLSAWVILENHYHLLIKISKAKDLPKLMKLINGRSSRRLKKLLTPTEARPSLAETRLSPTEGRLISLPYKGWKVWYNYWDHGIRDDKDYWKHFNYIHHNPVKHGYVKTMENYQFSSYNDYIKQYGEEWMLDALGKYPVIDFTPAYKSKI